MYIRPHFIPHLWHSEPNFLLQTTSTVFTLENPSQCCMCWPVLIGGGVLQLLIPVVVQWVRISPAAGPTTAAPALPFPKPQQRAVSGNSGQRPDPLPHLHLTQVPRQQGTACGRHLGSTLHTGHLPHHAERPAASWSSHHAGCRHIWPALEQSHSGLVGGCLLECGMCKLIFSEMTSHRVSCYLLEFVIFPGMASHMVSWLPFCSVLCLWQVKIILLFTKSV